MKQFILNEKTYIENILNDDLYICDSKPAPILALMAQYYYEIEGFRRKKIVELLQTFLEAKYPPYGEDKAKWDNIIAKIVKKTGGRNLLQINGIEITEKELETIAKINDKTLERLAFTMLCIAKFYKAKNPENGGWINTEIKDVFVAARINGNKVQQATYIHKLVRIGLIETTKRSDKLNLRVTFISDDTPKMIIDDFRELGYQYNYYKGDKFFHCQNCGILVKQYGNNIDRCLCKNCIAEKQIRKATCSDCGKVFTANIRAAIKCRCDECQKKRNKEKRAEWQKEHYEKSRSC